jgi:hypothetical protein
MIYLLEFLGLLAVAVALAASPLLIKLFGYLFQRERSAAPIRASNATRPQESFELRDEIRRLTQVLEMDNRAPRR